MGAFQPAVNGKWYGNWMDGEMHLHIDGAMPDGRAFKNHIRFHGIEENQFRWESRISHDNGNAWFTMASLIATRV